MTLVIAVIIKTSALFLRIHVELCEFYVQKGIFWIYLGSFPLLDRGESLQSE